MVEDHEPGRPAAGSNTGDVFMTLFQRVMAGILSEDKDARWQDHLRRWIIGGCGGVFYTALKNYFGAGIGIYGILTMDANSPRRGELMFGFVAAYLVSAGIGGFVAWLSVQKSGRLLFLIGMFGVQILLTLFPSLQSRPPERASWLMITPAYADGGNQYRCVGDSAFAKGFKAAFGIRDQFDKYAVIIASAKSPDDAQEKLKALSNQHPGLSLRVGPRACDNDYYPVFASEYLPPDDAKSLLEKIRKQTGISDAYLAPGPLY